MIATYFGSRRVSVYDIHAGLLTVPDIMTLAGLARAGKEIGLVTLEDDVSEVMGYE